MVLEAGGPLSAPRLTCWTHGWLAGATSGDDLPPQAASPEWTAGDRHHRKPPSTIWCSERRRLRWM